MKLTNKHSKILSLLLALALLLSVFSVVPFAVSAETAALNEGAPTRPEGNINYADDITGFGSSMYGADANSYAIWNSETNGFTMTSGFGNGAFLANGITVPATSEVVLETEMTVDCSARQDIIFRAASNANYYALYVFDNALALYKYVQYGGDDIHVANTTVAYTKAAGDKFVIRSGNGKVSVWVNGIQYFRDVAIDTSNYAVAFGANPQYWNGSNYTLNFANTDIYRTNADLKLDEPAPTRPENNVNYADYISGFGSSMYGADANTFATWDKETSGFTITTGYGNGAFLANGITVPATSEVVLETEMTVDSNERQDIIFRAASNANYYALYVFDNALALYKYVQYGGDDIHVANTTVAYTKAAGDKFVIRSGNGKVSVWVNGIQYFRDVAIDTDNYAVAFGANPQWWYGGAYTLTFANTDIYRTNADPKLDEPAPTRPEGNINYADDITGFGSSMWGADANSYAIWNSETNGFTMTSGFGNGAFLANGITVPATSEVVLETEMTVDSNERQDIIFRAASNANYYALYVFDNALVLYKYDLNGGADIHVADTTVAYTKAAGDKFVIRSGNGKVSVWVNGIQYFRDVAIDTDNYAVAFGANPQWWYGGAYTLTFANTDIYRTDSDPAAPKDDPVPNRPENNVNYADYISGFGYTMYGADTSAFTTWDKASNSFTMASGFGNGAFIAQGITVPATSEVVLETEMTVNSSERQDIIFRAASNANYYALYVSDNAMSLYKYDYYNGGDIYVATATVAYTKAAGDKFVIRSGNGKVSVWVNGKQYFKDIVIDTDNYGPAFGANPQWWNGSNYSLNFANTDIYRTDADPRMEDAVPTMPNGNVNYAEKLSGFTKSKWSSEEDPSTWPENYLTLIGNSITQNNHFDYGTGLVTGDYEIDGTKPYVLETDVTTTAVSDGRVDLIFRAKHLGEYYALYMQSGVVSLYKWTIANGDEFVASTYVPYNRPASGKSHVVILSTYTEVSVWIDGVQYFKDVKIEAGDYFPTVGFDSIGHVENEDTISLSNIKMYLNVIDYDMYYVPESDKYIVNNGVISSVAPGTSVETFRNNVTTASNIYTYAIFKDGVEVTTGNVGTGMEVKIYANGELTHSVHTVAVRGDLNSDGVIAAEDLVLLRKHLLGSEVLTGAYLKATDIYDTETEASVITLVWMKKAIAGINDPANPSYATTYSEDNFVVGAYVDGYNNSNPTAVFSALKNANIDLVIPHNNPINTSVEDYAEVLAAAESVGIDYLVDMKSISKGNTLSLREKEIKALTAKFNNASHAYGYYLVDEPNLKDFKNMNIVETLLNKFDPSAAVFSCLFPSYNAVYKWLDSEVSYDKYVDMYISQAKPQFLASDYYLYTETSSPDLNTYPIWKDMGYLRNKSIETGIPYWHVFQAITDYDLGTTDGMTMAKYSVQMNYALAYGCKGAVYFTANDSFCTPDGAISSFYNDLAVLNNKVQNIGNLIYNAEATEIYHPRLADSYTSEYYLSDVANSEIISKFSTMLNRNKNVIVSVFEDTDCYYLLVTNKSVEATSQYEITLNGTYSVRTYNAENNTMSDPTPSAKATGTVAAGDIAVLQISK